MPRHHRRRALTLLELLVVLASVALGAALLFPVFTIQREKSRAGTCQSNLKQIGLGIMQYCRDYDESLPRPVYGPPRVVWQQVVQPYIKSTSIFICPSNLAASARPLVSPAISVGYAHPAITRSYAINHRVSLGQIYGKGDLSHLGNPARKIMVAESRAADPDYGSPWWKPTRWSVGFAAHHGEANYMFADGHVKAMKPADTMTPFNMWGGLDAGACRNRDINCDTPDKAVAAILSTLR